MYVCVSHYTPMMIGFVSWEFNQLSLVKGKS